MGATFINPAWILSLLMMVLGGGVRDLASCLSTDAYWKAKGVTVSTEQLTHELDAVKPADVSKLIDGLDADDPKTRDEVTAKIAAFGPAAVPSLEEAVKNGSPEVVARANALLVSIRAGSKAASVRRLMAIRTLGEKKEAGALPLLHSLESSKEMFVADYAKSAIAKIEGKTYSTPAATDSDRAADVGLLPSRLDALAQAAPQIDGSLSIAKMLDGMPIPEDQKAKSIEEANAQILKVLDKAGNIRLDSVTWGFYAAPPGQPGNVILIAHGLFDAAALSTVIGGQIPNSSRIDGVQVFKIDDDSSLLVADGRVVFLQREPQGELGQDAMLAALKKGAGEFATNPDLPNLIKTVNTKAPLWAATKMATGLREIAGPLGEFDTATLVATQTSEHDKLVTHIDLEAVTSDAAKARQAVDNLRGEIKKAVEQGRQEEKNAPFIKPMVDFAESLKLDAVGGKATMTGTLEAMPMIPGMMMTSRVVEQQGVVAPNPPPNVK